MSEIVTVKTFITPMPLHSHHLSHDIPEMDECMLQAAQYRFNVYAIPTHEWEVFPDKTHLPWDRYDKYTGRLIDQNPLNFINYLHVAIRRVIVPRGDDEYYVQPNTPLYHVPTSSSDRVLTRIPIPHPKEPSEYPMANSQIPYLWKHMLPMPEKHPENDILYEHFNVCRNSEGHFFQIQNDDRSIYIRNLPPPNVPSNIKIRPWSDEPASNRSAQVDEGCPIESLPWTLTPLTLQLEEQFGKLPLQNPDNWINYHHPLVFKIVHKYNEVFFTIPNDRKRHTTSLTTFKWKQIKKLPHPSAIAPFPLVRKATSIPYLWKEKYFRETGFRTKREEITPKSNFNDYFRKEIMCTYDYEFYEMLPGYAHVSVYNMPLPHEEYTLAHRECVTRFDIPKLDNSAKA
jgi:hypothetical protein